MGFGRLQARLGSRHPIVVVRVEADGSVCVQEERKRVTDGRIRTEELASARLGADQIESMHRSLVHCGLVEFGPRAYSRTGGEVAYERDGVVCTTEFSRDAPEGGCSEGWLCPSGAADRVLGLFWSLSDEVRFRPTSGLPGWRPAPCLEPAAGVRRGAEDKACLERWEVPALRDEARPSVVLVTTFYLSGRVVRDEVELGDTGGIEEGSRRRPSGSGRVTPERLDAVHRMLREGPLFGAGTQTGTAYDGAEVLVLYHRGAIWSKTLCWEVEMGARCGLTAAENEGLDAVRALMRDAGL